MWEVERSPWSLRPSTTHPQPLSPWQILPHPCWGQESRVVPGKLGGALGTVGREDGPQPDSAWGQGLASEFRSMWAAADSLCPFLPVLPLSVLFSSERRCTKKAIGSAPATGHPSPHSVCVKWQSCLSFVVTLIFSSNLETLHIGLLCLFCPGLLFCF